jgi:chromosome segregation ATPase
MFINIFLAKIILGRDVQKDLAIAEKKEGEAQGKYNNACQTISALEEKIRVLSDSLDTSKQEFTSSRSEKDSIHALLSQLLNDEELCDAKAILEGRLDEKNALLGNLTEKLRSSHKEHDLILAQLGKFKEEKSSLDHDVDNLNYEIESLKEKSKQREEQKARISQRKEVREKLSTLKDKWQGTLDDFKARIDDADNLKSLEGLKRELVDYERLVNNAIEISVK